MQGLNLVNMKRRYSFLTSFCGEINSWHNSILFLTLIHFLTIQQLIPAISPVYCYIINLLFKSFRNGSVANLFILESGNKHSHFLPESLVLEHSALIGHTLYRKWIEKRIKIYCMRVGTIALETFGLLLIFHFL